MLSPRQIARTRDRQRWTTTTALAKHLGVTADTVRRWIRAGRLSGAQPESRHYSDERMRSTSRRRFRLYEEDVTRFLEGMRGGSVATRGLWRGRI